jgi:hypothetical protein
MQLVSKEVSATTLIVAVDCGKVTNRALLAHYSNGFKLGDALAVGRLQPCALGPSQIANIES